MPVYDEAMAAITKMTNTTELVIAMEVQLNDHTVYCLAVSLSPFHLPVGIHVYTV